MSSVLHLIDQSGPGGAQQIFIDLAAGFQERGWRTVAAVPRPGWVSEQLERRGLPVAYTPMSGQSFDLPYLRSIRRLIRASQADVVQAHLLGPAVYASLAGLTRRTPVVSTFHGQVDLAKNERFVSAKFGLINQAGRTVFVSERLRDSFLSRAPLDKARSRVIHNGVSFASDSAPSNVRAELGFKSTDIVVGAIGHLRPPKGYDVFLRAARALVSQSPHYRFLIAGQPEGDMLEQLVALRDELQLTDVVKFAGFRPDVDNVLAGTDIYLITSSSEGFSLSAVQAMSRGVPVVATRCGGPEEIVSHRRTGLLVDVGDVSGIATAVGELASDPALRDRLASAAASEVRERFGLDRMLNEYQKLYESLMARSGTKGSND